MRNLSLRIITACIGAFIAIWITYRGGYYFTSFACLLGALILYEYYKITHIYYIHKSIILTILFYLVLTLLFYLNIPFGYSLVFIIFALVVLYLLNIPYYWVPLGFVYASFPVWSLLYLRQFNILYIIYLFLIIWGTDIGGYIFGKTIGGIKLAPRISPNKTYAGAIGGVLLSLVVTIVYLDIEHHLSYNLLWAIIPLSLLAQFGDLAESFIKRKFGVKDSGVILPGHGGIMDRLDGLILSVSFFALVLFVNNY